MATFTTIPVIRAHKSALYTTVAVWGFHPGSGVGVALFAEAVESVAETSRSTLSEHVRWGDSASRLSARLEASVVELARTRARTGRIKPSRARVLLRLPLPKPNSASLFPQRGNRRGTFKLTLAMTDSRNVSLPAHARVLVALNCLARARAYYSASLARPTAPRGIGLRGHEEAGLRRPLRASPRCSP